MQAANVQEQAQQQRLQRAMEMVEQAGQEGEGALTQVGKAPSQKPRPDQHTARSCGVRGGPGTRMDTMA